LREVIVFGDVVYHVHNKLRHGSRCCPEELANARVRHLAVVYGVRLAEPPRLDVVVLDL
jgi:hypothetical protein